MTEPQLRSWGARPPRASLGAPRVQPFGARAFPDVRNCVVQPMFSARTRKTAPACVPEATSAVVLLWRDMSAWRRPVAGALPNSISELGFDHALARRAFDKVAPSGCERTNYFGLRREAKRHAAFGHRRMHEKRCRRCALPPHSKQAPPLERDFVYCPALARRQFTFALGLRNRVP